MHQDTNSLRESLAQFSLESERLESSYRNLQERFHGVHLTLQEFHTRLAGKLAELDFVSRYLESILDHMSQGILFVDLNGMVTTYNRAAQKMLAVPEQELLFHPFSHFFDDALFGFSLRQSLDRKECPPTTFVTRQERGEKAEWEVEALFVSMSRESYPLDHCHAASLPIQGLLILIRDRTRLCRLQEVAGRHERLKELGEWAAHLAHEIRNPLGGIKGFAGLLQQELLDNPELQKMAASIAQGVDQLDHCVSQVLLYARPVQIHLERIDLIHFLFEIRQFMQADPAWKSNIDFLIESPCSELFLPIDPRQFRSALLNLFVNAMQAMPEGGNLKVVVEPLDLWVLIRVEDTGEGIAPENLPKMFSPFFTTKRLGNGLGLAEVHKVVQALRGTIEVHSEVGKGTAFTIKLPMSEAELWP